MKRKEEKSVEKVNLCEILVLPRLTEKLSFWWSGSIYCREINENFNCDLTNCIQAQVSLILKKKMKTGKTKLQI